MRVHILNDYDYDCEVYPEGSTCTWIDKEKIYEVPDDLVKEYKAINERREELKEKILLVKRQGPL